jgi:hypothetical protein
VQIQGANNAPAGIVTALATYFNAINSGDYALAYAQLGPDKQKTTSEANFARGDATSQDTNVAIGAVNPTSNGSYLVDVSFTSQQSASDGPNGDQCDNWTLRYTMINSGGSWLIDATTGQNGVTHTSCG